MSQLASCVRPEVVYKANCMPFLKLCYHCCPSNAHRVWHAGAEDKREVRAEEPSLKLEDLKVEENSQSNGSVGSKVVYDGSGDVIPL